MRAFVIKNKEGKYWQWLFNHEPDWEEKLYNAFLHYSKEDAEKIIKCHELEDCEVVEITIEETKEKYFIRDCAFENLRLQKENLEQQLAEKDKEISMLKCIVKKEHPEIERITDTNNELTIILNKIVSADEKEIRKQVCEMIREMALDYYYFQGDAEKFDGNLYLISKFDLEENILNKLEQGEQQ